VSKNTTTKVKNNVSIALHHLDHSIWGEKKGKGSSPTPSRIRKEKYGEEERERKKISSAKLEDQSSGSGRPSVGRR